jgi:hypothetical protein
MSSLPEPDKLAAAVRELRAWAMYLGWLVGRLDDALQLSGYEPRRVPKEHK